MRFSAVQQSAQARLRNPGWWAAAVAQPLLLMSMIQVLPAPHKNRVLLELGGLGLVWIPGFLLCPAPWQWSGDLRPLPGWGRALLQMLGFALVIEALLAGMDLVLALLLPPQHRTTAESAWSAGFLLGFSLPVLLFMGIAGLVAAQAERLAQETREAQTRARDAQWMSHRGAFSPRLLFSSLNHLADTAAGNSPGTEQGLVDLATLYRSWLTETELPLVALATERGLANQYLALERRRWGNLLTVRWQQDPALDRRQVPPLLLQPMLEAALGGPAETGLDMEIIEQSGAQGFQLHLRVRGTAPAPAEPLIEALRQQLRGSLGRSAEVEPNSSAQGWAIAYSVPVWQDEKATMIIHDTLSAISGRFRRPLNLGLMAGFFAFDVGMLMLSMLAARLAPPGTAMPVALFNAKTIVCIALGIMFLFGVSPIAWQWTGDSRLMARPLRGILQGLLLNGAVVAGNLLVNWSDNARRFESVVSRAPHPLAVKTFFPLMGIGMVMSLGFHCAVSFALAFWETKTAEKNQALAQAEEARWSLLKAQMSPHVLLNSLNGLAELVRDDTAAAVKGMRDLAEIYRQLLTMGEAPQVPLAEERKLLERYLDMEKLRLGEALRVEWDWAPDLDAVPAMPLLLQPLVENAIKHGVAADPAGGRIRVSGRRDDRTLILTVANTGQALVARPSKGTGVGLRNLRSRLELAYAGKARFELVCDQPWTRAELRIPLEVCP